MKNPDEFMNGAIPEVSGSGPYVFDKKLENRVVSAENGTCEISEILSRISSMSRSRVRRKFVEAASTEGMKAAATTLLSQTAFLEVEVEELLFEGYKDPFLDKVCEIPFMNFVCEAILDVPERIGLFFEANNTASKMYEIDDGTRDPTNLGKILKYDEEPLLDETWWSTEESLKIRGTDGSLFHPFLSKNEKLYVYVAELCRSIWLEFKEEVEYRGLKAYRYVVPPEVFDVTYPGNEGYCNPSDKQFFSSQNDSVGCLPKGLLEISKCQKSQPPITISLPNFLYAPSEVRESVKGLNGTDDIRDSIVVDIEPRVGAVLYARRVSQVNIEMWKGKNLTFPVNLKKMKSALIPVIILHETSEIDDDSLETIRSQLYETESIAYTSCNIMMIIGAIVLLLGFLFLAFSYQEEHEKKLRKCLYVSRCKSLKGFRRDLTWRHPHDVEDELETYHLDEFDGFMKMLRKKERVISSLEEQYFPGVITCYPEDIAEFFEKRWKRIKKSFVSAKNNICNCFKRSPAINQ
ncbi:hypothetical protein GCK72_008769 [Caenorhabditis remanei]|uniref:Uncharacterized protein n=1 Tax=Caenorhabditis remanei TaxID=31234 RepID=A0A6A5GYE9_CAERE|nr:hypothetical protein GCK72_008769 [Caenorhabditis remanei]KAF1760520.1 hypothetical protein GCK72_008769 [Caenorhabditis remanei]